MTTRLITECPQKTHPPTVLSGLRDTRLNTNHGLASMAIACRAVGTQKRGACRAVGTKKRRQS